jgi:thiosulfate dehydrogenase (quinone) large subunit
MSPAPQIERAMRDPRSGMVWLAARLFVGWKFLEAGWDKVTGSGWLGSTEGIHGFLGAASSPEATTGEHASVSHWYAWLVSNVFLHVQGPLSYLVPFGEVAIGIGLILGVLTLGAAFFGALLNLLFMLSGSLSAGINPIMFGLELLIMFAGAAAYVYGIDRVLLPEVRGRWARRNPSSRPAAAPPPAPIPQGGSR